MKNLSILLIIVFTNCNEETPINIEEQTSLRTEFLKQHSTVNIKEEFFKLDDIKQHQIWSEKINQVQKSNIPTNIKNKIEILKHTFDKIESMSDIIKVKNELEENLKELIDDVPQEELVKMFMVINDYVAPKIWKKVTENTKCLDCLSQMNTINATSRQPMSLPKCNCNWSCDYRTEFLGHDSCGPCERTFRGCGFFGINGCYRRTDIQCA